MCRSVVTKKKSVKCPRVMGTLFRKQCKIYNKVYILTENSANWTEKSVKITDKVLNVELKKKIVKY